MSFSIALTGPSTPVRQTGAHLRYADYEAAVMEICALLSETDCTFQVRGFGVRWPVDVRYDLSTVMEQLPDLLSAIRNGSVGHLDFYGQGLERTLEFSPVGRQTVITCVSRIDFEPAPERETLGTESLVAMLGDFAERFARAASKVAPSLSPRPSQSEPGSEKNDP